MVLSTTLGHMGGIGGLWCPLFPSRTCNQPHAVPGSSPGHSGEAGRALGEAVLVGQVTLGTAGSTRAERL